MPEALACQQKWSSGSRLNSSHLSPTPSRRAGGFGSARDHVHIEWDYWLSTDNQLISMVLNLCGIGTYHTLDAKSEKGHKIEVQLDVVIVAKFAFERLSRPTSARPWMFRSYNCNITMVSCPKGLKCIKIHPNATVVLCSHLQNVCKKINVIKGFRNNVNSEQYTV